MTASTGPAGAAPPLLISMGDPAGIGPEIVCRAAALGQLGDAVVVGGLAVMQRAAALLHARGVAVPPLAAVGSPGGEVPPGALAVWPVLGAAEDAALAALPWGRVDARCGAAAHRAVVAGAEACLQGVGAALVTAPLHKEALAAAGVPFPGHTELLQHLAGRGATPPPVRMMLANDVLRVVLVTVHMALRDAVQAIDRELVLQTLRITAAAAPGFGWPAPRIAVAGLNPHAGEGGLFGDEEIAHIAPAIAQARAEGIDASGPHAPDTVFMRARAGAFDLVVAMTHDHGLIPVKYLGLDEGVNVTLGLPFLRTSPDHGTAFDIAGQGRADARSLVSAVRFARAALNRRGRLPPSAAGG